MSHKKICLLDLENEFKSSKQISEINSVLKKYLLQLGITTFSFTYYSHYPNSLNKIKYDFASDNFLIWHQHYLNENYEEIDSTLEKSQLTVLPEFWDLQQQLKDSKSERERQMRLDSISFGAEKGLSIPIYGPSEDFAILTLVQMKGENCLELWQTLQYTFFSLAYYYYFYLSLLLLKTQPVSKKHDLSQRELQCLSLIAKQYSVDAISKKLNITPRTVQFHIQRINKKFGAKNKYQSVAKALQKGFIKN